MPSPTTRFKLPHFDDSSAFAPIQGPFNAISDALEASLVLVLPDVADLTALAALTGMPNAALARVTEGGALFSYDLATAKWIQQTPATFASSSARATAYAKASGIYVAGDAAASNAFCILQKSGTQSLTTTLTPLVLDVEASDSWNMHDNSVNNTRITARAAGTYQVIAQTYNNNTSGTGVIQARLNGTTDVVGSFTRRDGTANAATPLSTSFSLVMSANDYIEIMVSHSAATGGIVGGTATAGALITVGRIGPAA